MDEIEPAQIEDELPWCTKFKSFICCKKPILKRFELNQESIPIKNPLNSAHEPTNSISIIDEGRQKGENEDRFV